MLLKEIIERDKNLMAFFHLLSNIKKKKKNEEFLDLGLQCPRKKVLLKVTQFYSSHYWSNDQKEVLGPKTSV